MFFRRLLFVTMAASLLGAFSARFLGPHLPELVGYLWRVVEPQASGQSVAEDPGAATVDEGAGSVAAEPEPAAPAVAAPSPGKQCKGRTRRRAPAKGDLSAELSRGIRTVGDRRCVIDRAALDLALRNLPSLSAWIRVAPDIRDGKPAGFRLLTVAPGGPFAKLGLRAGDVLVSVNGHDLRSADRALDAYAKLKSSSRFSLGLVRDGREQMHEYTVR